MNKIIPKETLEPTRSPNPKSPIPLITEYSLNHYRGFILWFKLYS